MKLTLKNKDGDFLKEIDTEETQISFTSNKKEAKTYQNEWFATVEAEYVQYHFKELGEKVTTLYPYLVSDEPKISSM